MLTAERRTSDAAQPVPAPVAYTVSIRGIPESTASAIAPMPISSIAYTLSGWRLAETTRGKSELPRHIPP